MSILHELIPSNFLEEKEKFFTDHSYNPQFRYQRHIEPSELVKYGHPSQKLFTYAWEKMQQTLPEEEYLNEISEEYVVHEIEQFNEKYHLSQPMVTYFSETFPTRCRVRRNEIFFRLPITYNQETFADLLRHELETHVFRTLNHQQQPWKNEMKPDAHFRRTEEGLAGLHSYLLRKDKAQRRSLLNYIAIYLAEQESFAKVFQALRSLSTSFEMSWEITLRAKRGLEDTSQPGAFTKDICYLEGMIDVWKWMMNEQNNPRNLYLGRISLHQVAGVSLRSDTKTDELLYPTFFDNLSEYLHNIKEIGQTNAFDRLM